MPSRALRGSITVFLSLCSLVFLTLFAAVFSSVATASGRVLAANALDQAVYSLLSRYDRDLWGSFDLFALSGNENGPDFGRCLSDVRENAELILHPGTLLTGYAAWPDLVMEGVSVTAAGTLCGENGDALLRQAVEFMEDTLGVQAVQLLSGSVWRDASSLSSLEKAGEDAVTEEKDALLRDIEKAREEKAAGSASAPAGAAPQAETQDAPPDQTPSLSGEEAGRRLGVLRKMRASSLLTFAVRDPDSISGSSLPEGFAPSSLSPFPAVGLQRPAGSAEHGTDRLLLSEYLLRHFASFREPTKTASLAYQTEYLLFGKKSDTENLEECVRSLHRIRCGAAMITFLSDGKTMQEARSTAEALCASAGVPELTPALSAVLIGALAWTQGALDVRALLAGFRVPLLHRDGTQLTFETLPLVLSEPDTLLRDDPSGLGYEAYLRMLLCTCNYQELRERVPAMIEDTIRVRYARPSFRIDGCLDMIELSMDVHIEEMLHVTVVGRQSYRKGA
ncbi:MAG: hypothetical protein IJL72_03130 [Lachnospiraceae bacterium]|nr:hypothetical protein [Lachnospiraceae bacterium]